MNFPSMTNQALLEEIGTRIQRERLNQNTKQCDLAKNAGISVRALSRLETGEGCTLANFLRVLRALNRLEQLDNFIPKATYSPVQLARLQGSVRERASSYRKGISHGKKQ